MMQIPDNVRRPLELLAKYHFWLLAAVVPLVLLPLYFMASWHLDAEMQSARRRIEDRLAALKAVEKINPHPNEKWAAEINAATTAIKRETFGEWSRFWKSESTRRIWPASLGDDFVQKAAALKPDGKLSRKLLERYQNGIRAVVRTLPGRMGANEAMLDKNAESPAGQAPAHVPNALVVWSESDQQRLFASFNWEKAPSTTQVVLAQEELWVYELLCDVIARVNRGAAGSYNAPIPLVQQLAVGYPAAEESPGGAGTGRIKRPAAAAGGEAAAGGAPLESAPEPPPPVVPAVRPAHPRFGGSGASAAPSPAPGGEGSPPGESAADDSLRNWIYVDFEGRPQDSAAVAKAVESQMVHFMPFVMTCVIDQRRLDTLLVELATAEWPIDVRQIRINTTGGAAPGGGPAPGPSGTPPAAEKGLRLHDIHIELRGSIALATQPNETVIGLEPPPPAAEPAAGESPPPSSAGIPAAPTSDAAPAAERAPDAGDGQPPTPPAEAKPPADQPPAAADAERRGSRHEEVLA